MLQSGTTLLRTPVQEDAQEDGFNTPLHAPSTSLARSPLNTDREHTIGASTDTLALLSSRLTRSPRGRV